MAVLEEGQSSDGAVVDVQLPLWGTVGGGGGGREVACHTQQLDGLVVGAGG